MNATRAVPREDVRSGVDNGMRGLDEEVGRDLPPTRRFVRVARDQNEVGLAPGISDRLHDLLEVIRVGACFLRYLFTLDEPCTSK